jgi:hypothetical protein
MKAQFLPLAAAWISRSSTPPRRAARDAVGRADGPRESWRCRLGDQLGRCMGQSRSPDGYVRPRLCGLGDRKCPPHRAVDRFRILAPLASSRYFKIRRDDASTLNIG